MMLAVTNTQALWFMTRGTGLVALLLLTASVALGITEVTRWTSPRLPRFVIAALHKNISLLVVIFLAIHIVTAIGDGFAPIGWLDVVIPFHSPYRPIWLGLGAVAVDLLIALIVTSLLRNRMGYPAWRAVHWIAYVCWPAAFLHGVGTGSDTRATWSLAISIACLFVILAALWWRLVTARGVAVAPRAWSALGSVVVVLAILGWTFTGPAQPGWARKAGTPASLLGGTRASSALAAAGLRAPFDAALHGTISQTLTGANRARVTIVGSLSGGASGKVDVSLQGPALDEGGVQMDSSVATLGTAVQPSLYQGSVVALDGANIRARVRDAAGHELLLSMQLNIAADSSTVTGSVSARGVSN